MVRHAFKQKHDIDRAYSNKTMSCRAFSVHEKLCAPLAHRWQSFQASSVLFSDQVMVLFSLGIRGRSAEEGLQLKLMKAARLGNVFCLFFQ